MVMVGGVVIITLRLTQKRKELLLFWKSSTVQASLVSSAMVITWQTCSYSPLLLFFIVFKHGMAWLWLYYHYYAVCIYT